MKTISVTKINDIIFVKGFSITTEGWRIGYGPYLIGRLEDGEEALGRLCLKTFNECKIGIPHPEDTRSSKSIKAINPYDNSEEEKLLNKLKKTNKDYRLSINYDNEKYSLIPCKVVSKSGASYLPEKTIYSDGDPKNLGKTLLQAFELCE